MTCLVLTHNKYVIVNAEVYSIVVGTYGPPPHERFCRLHLVESFIEPSEACKNARSHSEVMDPRSNFDEIPATEQFCFAFVSRSDRFQSAISWHFQMFMPKQNTQKFLGEYPLVEIVICLGTLRARYRGNPTEISAGFCEKVNEEAVTHHWKWWSKYLPHKLSEQSEAYKQRWDLCLT